MCIGFWTLSHPKYSLILCSNRDEYLSRPTRPAEFHSRFSNSSSPTPDILSGVDDKSGGTWLGMNRSTGRIAFLTNITEPYQQIPSSRGHLVSSYLQHGQIPDPSAKYAGFNLLLLDRSSPSSFRPRVFTNNGAEGPIVEVNSTEKQANCISNGLVDVLVENQWPKVVKGSHDFESALESVEDEGDLVEKLMHVLSWESPEPITQRSDLRKTIRVLPLSVGPDLYGTRLSTVILIERDTGKTLFVERDIYMVDEMSASKYRMGDTERRLRFTIENEM